MSNEKSEKNIINNIKINEARNNLIELFIEYQSINKFRNRYSRFLKNSYKKSAIIVFGNIICAAIIYTLGCFFVNKYLVGVIIVWITTLAIAILVIKKEWANFEDYRKELFSRRDDAICELLVKKRVNSTNIKEVIDYFALDLEPVKITYKEPPILKSILNALSSLFFLILGTLIGDIMKYIDNQDRFKIYEMIARILFFIIVIIVFIKILCCINRIDIFSNKTRKLIRELKRIELLN